MNKLNFIEIILKTLLGLKFFIFFSKIGVIDELREHFPFFKLICLDLLPFFRFSFVKTYTNGVH